MMPRHIKYHILLLFYATNIFSQERSGTYVTRIDSLNHQLSFAKTDTEKIELHIALANVYYWNMTDSMIAHAEKAKTISEKIHFQKGLFQSYFTLASSRFVTGEYGKGLRESKQALAVARMNNNEEWEAKICNTIGLLYIRSGKYKDAIDNFEILVELDKKNNNTVSLASAYNNLANCYLSLKEYQPSITIRKQSIRLRKMIGEESPLADSYNDLGETYIGLDQNDSAIFYLLNALTIKQRIGDDEMCAVASQNLGRAYANLKDYASAKRYLNKSYQWSEKINSNIYILENLKLQAEIANKEDNNKLEAKLLNRILSLRDSIYTDENRKQINQLNAEFDSEKNELKITSLQLEQQKQQVVVDEEKKINLLIIIFSALGILLLGSLLYVVNSRFRITKKQKQIIEDQKKVVEEKNKSITDSIQYAKRIQRSLLPTEKYIDKQLKRLTKK